MYRYFFRNTSKYIIDIFPCDRERLADPSPPPHPSPFSSLYNGLTVQIYQYKKNTKIIPNNITNSVSNIICPSSNQLLHPVH